MTASLTAWKAFTTSRGIAFDTDLSDGRCSLVLTLADGVGAGDRVVRMEFRGVADLKMRGLGGGVSQLCGLEVEDISSRRLDRVHFRVFDVEHDAIEFLCDSFTCYDEPRCSSGGS